MLVVVRFFAASRDAVGQSQIRLSVPDDATLATVRQALLSSFPALRAVLAKSRLAVNRQYREDTHPMGPGDDVVVIPPVAGGAGEPARADHCAVAEQPIDAAAVLARVADQTAGGFVVFHGVVRNRSNGGRAVEYLEYEAYREMAEEQLAVVAAEARTRWDVTGIAIEHRVGKLVVGDTAVVIAVAAVHRAEAFAACQYCIDRLKEVVPIWKRETGPDGAVWVE